MTKKNSSIALQVTVLRLLLPIASQSALLELPVRPFPHEMNRVGATAQQEIQQGGALHRVSQTGCDKFDKRERRRSGRRRHRRRQRGSRRRSHRRQHGLGRAAAGDGGDGLRGGGRGVF